MAEKTKTKPLYELRKEKNMSQIAVAAVLNIHVNTYVMWERGGGEPSEENARRLNSLFGEGKWRTGV